MILKSIILFASFLFSLHSTTQDFDLESLMKRLKNSSSILDDDITFDTDDPSQVSKDQIANITCITERYGLGYIGTKNITHDGVPCIEWSRNLALYTRYRIRGKNITRNYCRNPDNDSMGPWCFVEKRTNLKSQFKYKHCGIGRCKINENTINEAKKFSMGVPMLLQRQCPVGFKMTDNRFCVVLPEFLNKLPNGSYSLQVDGDKLSSSPNCYPGFKEEHITNTLYGMKSIICNKESTLNGSIEFPNYITPVYGDLIFMTISTAFKCPSMMSETSIVIKRSRFFHHVQTNVCYYFYKLSKIKYSTDKKLAFLTTRKDCPVGWILKAMEYRWKYAVSIYLFSGNRPSNINACVPEKDINDYPDGNYCLLSLSQRFQSLECPSDFIKVTTPMIRYSSYAFCCRERKDDRGDKTNMALFNFLNFSSVLYINNGNLCYVNFKDSNIRSTSYRFEASTYDRAFQCTNCDLVKAFTITNSSSIYHSRNTFFKVSFTTCHYERIINGFAYASMNFRCPPDMDYAYVKYSTAKYMYYRKLSAVAKFCTKINYSANISFPKGTYCVYKIGVECPNGFQNHPGSLPLYAYKTSESNGNIPNYQSNAYCCRNDSGVFSFENQTLPYVTGTFEFGLPFPNSSYSCVHGLASHTAVDDSHMCEYTPRTNQLLHTTIIYPADRCLTPSYTYYGPYRLIYFGNIPTRYCYCYVKNNPPPGNYCIIAAKNCPAKYFNYVTYHPLSRAVICCRNNVSNNSSVTLTDWVNDLKGFNLLAYKGKCHPFNGYNFGKSPSRLYNSYQTTSSDPDHLKNISAIGFRTIKSRNYNVRIDSCVYKMDPFNKSSTWPHGNYALPKTYSNCPTDFKSGYFTHSMESASPSFAHSDIIHLDGDYMIGGSTIKWGFCVKKDTFRKDRLSLPYGRYCVMKVGYKCPDGFKEGSVKFVEITAINNLFIQRKGDLPEIDNDGPFITYHFCCQSGIGDVAHDTINLPIDSGPFYLFKFGSHCQKVEGMRFTEEFICIDSEDSAQYLNFTFAAPYKVEGFTPITGSYARGCDFQINLCYYEKDSPKSRTSTKKPAPSLGWPKGSYVFVKALGQKCPPLFDEGRIVVHAKFKIDQKFLSTLMFGASNEKESVLTYCERNSTSLDSLYPQEAWPKGVYCVIFEKKCPQGMLRHKFKSINNIVFSLSWENLCCKKDNLSKSDDLPFFPADQYSFLVLPTHEVHTCPEHKGMRVALINLQSEILCYYEKRNEDIELPDGDYLLPAPWKPQEKCPPGFVFVSHYHTNITGADQPSKELKFCQKENKGSNGTKFPRGNYCILTMNDECPSTQFTAENTLVIPLHKFTDQKYKLSRYLACCQNDGHLISNMVGMKVPFQMFGSSLCSYVHGMVNANEAEETTILQQRGVIERPPYIKATKKLRLCRYDQVSLWNYDSRCQCHENAACFLTFDDVRCRCKSGFFGDGKTVCSKITNSTDRCGNACNSERSMCVAGTINKCVCKEGYEGDGFDCKPSCSSRPCDVFSHCVVNSLESYCACLPTSIVAKENRCHGDFLSTISLLEGFDQLTKLDLSCLSKASYDHLISSKNGTILFIIMPQYFKCERFSNYQALVQMKLPTTDRVWKTNLRTEGGQSIKVTVDEKNQWTINDSSNVFKADRFTNAIVLYLNTTFIKPNRQRSNKDKLVSKDPIIAGYLCLTLLLIAAVVISFMFIVKRKRIFGFNRLQESRSESNIHFISAENKVEIDS